MDGAGLGLHQWFSSEESPAMQETQETRVRSQGQEDSLEEGMATYSSILAWRIPWTEEPGGLPFMGSQRVDVTEATDHKHRVGLNVLRCSFHPNYLV